MPCEAAYDDWIAYLKRHQIFPDFKRPPISFPRLRNNILQCGSGDLGSAAQYEVRVYR